MTETMSPSDTGFFSAKTRFYPGDIATGLEAIIVGAAGTSGNSGWNLVWPGMRCSLLAAITSR